MAFLTTSVALLVQAIVLPDAMAFLAEGGLEKDGCYYLEDEGNPASPVSACVGNQNGELIILRHLERESAKNSMTRPSDAASESSVTGRRCYWLTLDATDGEPVKACLGEAQGEMAIAIHLTQSSYGNSRAHLKSSAE